MTMLRVRWLGRVPYGEADELQRALLERAADDYLLLLEHPHVYTLGKSADPAHVLVPPASVGADLVRTDRGGDVTYHGPGQLVGYPIVTLPEWRAGQRDVVAYVRRLEVVRASGSVARRSPRSASGSPAAAPATASPSTSPPTSRCSTTSSRAASPIAASPLSRRNSITLST